MQNWDHTLSGGVLRIRNHCWPSSQTLSVPTRRKPGLLLHTEVGAFLSGPRKSDGLVVWPFILYRGKRFPYGPRSSHGLVVGTSLAAAGVVQSVMKDLDA